MNVIITEDLYDHDFVDNWCHGFDKLAKYVVDFTPAWASNITGISAEKIVAAAHMMATIKPTCISTGNGVGDQTNDGTSTIMAIRLISAITGQIGIPGTINSGVSVGSNLISTGASISSLANRATADMYDKQVASEFPVWYQRGQNQPNTTNPSVTQPGGLTSAYFKGLSSVLTGKPYPLRVVCGQHTNPFGATRQPKKIAEVLEKLEFYRMDLIMTGSAVSVVSHARSHANNLMASRPASSVIAT